MNWIDPKDELPERNIQEGGRMVSEQLLARYKETYLVVTYQLWNYEGKECDMWMYNDVLMSTPDEYCYIKNS